ncbi:Replication factor A protein 3, partial [Neolecta irregularis DAH-3]
MDKPTPRINAPRLEKNIGLSVRLVGKVKKLQHDTAIIDSLGDVTIRLTRVIPTSTQLTTKDSNFDIGKFYEIIGKVNADLSISIYASTDFGSNI